jgi:hypothetical protein
MTSRLILEKGLGKKGTYEVCYSVYQMLPAYGINEESIETGIWLGKSINLSVDPRVKLSSTFAFCVSEEDGIHVTLRLPGSILLEVFPNV